jgi:hypothetical protein
MEAVGEKAHATDEVGQMEGNLEVRNLEFHVLRYDVT